MPSSNAISAKHARTLAERLCVWYRQAGRALPWRESKDPYAIWVSEVMLQQTRVEAVLSHYTQFLRRFPDLRSLAQADLGEVLAAWAGLGYYRRARQLHASARRIHFDQGSRWPRDAASLRLLPGFGPYTAGAVASIAFGQSVPAIDGNVERVLTRLLGVELAPKLAAAQLRIRSTAEMLLVGRDPSELNQALMELGALVCTARAPSCAACPWSGNCVAESLGPEHFPRRTPRPQTIEVACYTAVSRQHGAYLLRQLPEDVHNAGLFELPTTPWHVGAPDPQRARIELEQLSVRLGLRWSVSEPLLRIRHSITQHRIRCVAYAVQSASESASEQLWLEPADARRRGLTGSARKILDRLESGRIAGQSELFAAP